MDKILFIEDDGNSVEFYVVEKTKINEREYLLVTDQEDGDSEALILKDMSDNNSEESCYVCVSEDEELQAVAKVFENLLEDITFE
jgi:hypothetical protein